MKKKEECALVRELLPIYCDDAVGDEGKAVIEKHLKECKECSTYKEEIAKMKEEEAASQDKMEAVKTEQVTKVSKKLRRHKKKVDLIRF